MNMQACATLLGVLWGTTGFAPCEAEPPSPQFGRHVRFNRAAGCWMAEVSKAEPGEAVILPGPVTPTTAGAGPLSAKTAGSSTDSGLFLETSSAKGFATRVGTLEFPRSGRSAVVAFEFSFATDEFASDLGLLDALSVTFQENEGLGTWLLLTVDASGVAWAPANPGGIAIGESDLVRKVAPGVSNLFGLPTLFTFSVTARLPDTLLGRSGRLYVDLYDNENGRESAGQVVGVAVSPGRVFVESSSMASGPYAEESGIFAEEPVGSLSVPQAGLARYYRLRSETGSMRIHAIHSEGDDWVFEYRGEGPSGGGAWSPVLQSSARAVGPFADELAARIDRTSQVVRLSRIAPVRFYRLRSRLPLSIRRIDKFPSEIRLSYE